MNVSDIMRRSFATIKPDALLLDAAHLLLETNQRGLPVIDREGALVGVVSEGDFLHRTRSPARVAVNALESGEEDLRRTRKAKNFPPR